MVLRHTVITITIILILLINFLPVNGQSSDDWASKGNTLSGQGKLEEAIKCFDKALELNHNSVVAWNNKGLALLNLGKPEEALKCIDRALELAPENPIIWNSKGNALYKQRKYEEAIRYFDKVLETNPDSEMVKNAKNIALEKLEMNKYGIEAPKSNNGKIISQKPVDKNEEVRRVYEKDKNIWEMYFQGVDLYNVSDFYGALNKFEEACSAFKKANSKEGISSALFGIGNVYSEMGDYFKALNYYKQIMDLNGYGKTLNQPYKIEDEINISDGKQEWLVIDLDTIEKIEDKIERNKLKSLKPLVGRHLLRSKLIKELKPNFSEDEIKIILENSSATLPDASEFEGGTIVTSEKQPSGIDLQITPAVSPFDTGKKKPGKRISNRMRRSMFSITDEDEVITLSAIGRIYRCLGNYSESLKYCNDAVRVFRLTGGEMTFYSDLGLVYIALGDSSKGEECIHKSPTVSNIPLGDYYLTSGNYSMALACYKKTMEEANLYGDWQLKMNALKSIGNAYLEKNDLAHAYEIFRELDDPLYFGEYYLAKKEYGKAKEQFIKALEHVEKQKNAEKLVILYIGLGLSEEALKNYEGAEKYYLKAVDFIEAQRSSLPQTGKKNFFEGKVGIFSRLTPYEGLVRIYYYLKRGREGFLYAESTKARLLSEEIARKYEEIDCRLPDEISNKERELVNNIASVYKQLEFAYGQDNQKKINELEDDLKILKSDWDKFTGKLRQDYPEYASIMYPKPMKVEEIKLKQGEVLIEYEVTDRETIGYLIRNGQIVKCINIKIIRDDLTTLVKAYRGAFEDIKDYGELGNFSPETGKQLYDLLLKDLVTQTNGEKIIIVPDEILGILPFEAIVMEFSSGVKFKQGQYGPCPEGVKYVGDTYSISYYQSASSLSIIRNLNKGAGKKGVFAVADPVFSEKDDRITGMAQVNPMTDYEIIRMDAMKNNGGFTFLRLKLTGDMVNGLGSLFPGEIESITGTDATESAVKNKDLSGYKYLVFATHGILDDDVPYIKEPALVLTLVGNIEEDGFLTMGEVMNMNMGANVAVLSACKTGLGRNVSGEGIMGMSRAFQYAGVKSALMSLWSVESVSTNMMTEKFFEGLKQGKSNREALKEARAYIRSQGYEHPFFWAPFILVGD